MKSLVISFYAIILTVFSGCTGSDEKVFHETRLNGRKVQEIFLDRVPEEARQLNFSDIFSSCRAIPLETKDECLIQNVFFTLAGEDLLVGTQNFPGPARLFRFDRNGKFLNEIGRGGKGPGEHTGYMQDFCRYDDKDKTVLVKWDADDSQLFTLQGALIKTINMPFWGLQDMFKWNEGEWFSTGTSAGVSRYPRDSMLLVFFRDDGEITRAIPRTLYPPKNTKGYVPSSWGTSVYQNNSKRKFYFSGIDTLFSLENSKLVPAGILHSGKNAQEYNTTSDPEYQKGKYSLKFLEETENNIFIKRMVIEKADLNQYRPGRWGGSFELDDQLIVIDKGTGKAAVCKFGDDMYGFIPEQAIENLEFDESGYVTLNMQISDMLDMIKEYESKGNVSPEIAARLEPLKKLNEDDNPVIFLFKINDRIRID